MDPIKEKIILQLQKQPEPISSTRLAEQLHVSSRRSRITLRRSIRNSPI